MRVYDLDCSIEEAKAICRTLSQHIIQLTNASSNLLSGKFPAIRPAYVLTLLALEESGKMFSIWQSGAKAEDEKFDRVQVQNLFRDHRMKGGLASDLCCQMFETVANWMMELEKTGNPEMLADQSLVIMKKEFEKAIVHLKGVYQAYTIEREATMYVSHDGNIEWESRSKEISEVIDSEVFLIWFVAGIANIYLVANGSFSLAIKALLDIKNGMPSDQIKTFFGLLRVGLSQQLSNYGRRSKG